MKRIYLLLNAATLLACLFCSPLSGKRKTPQPAEPAAREYWIATLDRTALPVLTALSEQRLKAAMPLETKIDRAQHVGYLEAFGRTLTPGSPRGSNSARTAPSKAGNGRATSNWY